MSKKQNSIQLRCHWEVSKGRQTTHQATTQGSLEETESQGRMKAVRHLDHKRWCERCPVATAAQTSSHQATAAFGWTSNKCNSPESERKRKPFKLCPTLCDPVDYTVHGILQARIPEWVAIPFSSRSSWPRMWTRVSCIAGGFPKERIKLWG